MCRAKIATLEVKTISIDASPLTQGELTMGNPQPSPTVGGASFIAGIPAMDAVHRLNVGGVAMIRCLNQ